MRFDKRIFLEFQSEKVGFINVEYNNSRQEFDFQKGIGIKYEENYAILLWGRERLKVHVITKIKSTVS